MAAVSIHCDSGAQEKNICHYFHFFPISLTWSDGTGCHDFECWVLSQLFHSLLSPTSRVFSNTTVQKHHFFSIQLSLRSNSQTSIHDYWKNHSFDYVGLCQWSNVSVFNTLSRFVIAFLPRSRCLLISWLQSPSAVILEPKKSLTFHCFSSIYLSWCNGTGCHDLCFLNVEF